MDSARKLNPDAFDAVGNLKSLLEQYGEVQLRRELDPTFRMPHPFIVAVDGGITGVERLSDLPLVLTARSLRHIVNKHDASVAVLNHLAEELMGNVLAFEHGENPDKMTFVLDRNTNGGNELIVVIHADMLINRVEVAAVRSCHGKDVSRLLEFVEEALDSGREVYVNRRTGAWLDVQKHMPGMSELAKKAQAHLSEIYYSKLASWEALNSLLAGECWFCPEEGEFVSSYLNESEPELIINHITLEDFVAIRDEMKADGRRYEDGVIAPYEIAADYAESAFSIDYRRLDLDSISRRIASGGWVRAGADIDKFIAESSKLLVSRGLDAPAQGKVLEMGYVVNTIDSCFVLERGNYEEAFKAVCELNAHDELKTGGRYPATEAKPEGSKSLGNPNVWFPWMPWDYDVTCSGIVEVFETLGFDVVEDARGISCLWYDGKSGAEEVFFEAVAPYVKEGSSITFQGEDGTLIRYSFDGKGVEQRIGEVFQEIDLYTIPQAEKILRERGWASPEEIAARLSDGLAGAAAVEKTRKTI